MLRKKPTRNRSLRLSGALNSSFAFGVPANSAECRSAEIAFHVDRSNSAAPPRQAPDRKHLQLAVPETRSSRVASTGACRMIATINIAASGDGTSRRDAEGNTTAAMSG